MQKNAMIQIIINWAANGGGFTYVSTAPVCLFFFFYFRIPVLKISSAPIPPKRGFLLICPINRCRTTKIARTYCKRVNEEQNGMSESSVTTHFDAAVAFLFEDFF